jgi:hypothetical protein
MIHVNYSFKLTLPNEAFTACQLQSSKMSPLDRFKLMFATYLIQWCRQMPRQSNPEWIARQINTYIEHRWNDIGRENLKFCGKYLFHYNFLCNKSLLN